MKQNLVHFFGTLEDCTLTEIDKLAKSKAINNFEQKAFSAFCIAAQIAAENLLKLENLPYDKVEKINDLNIIADAYFFLCAVELHAFLERAKNNKKIGDALSTPKNNFIKHFAMCFGGKEDEDYFNKMLTFFDKVVIDMGDPRDLWYNQLLWFSNKISGSKIDFTQLKGRELADTITLSLVSQNLRIMSVKLFDRIVFGKEHHEFSEMTDSQHRRMGQDKWLKRALRKGKITQEFYDSESKKIKGEFNQAQFAETQERIKKMSGKDNPTLDMKNGHIVIKLVCPRCGTEGENTYGNIAFVVLGKDRKGFSYFECPNCKEHLKYDPITGRIRIRKGILGFLFGKFS